jgi:hypothetical protein
MNGAREYAQLFGTGTYGKLYIDSGQHARGYYFHIWVLPEGVKDLDRSRCVEVFGILGGHPGWTEWYGWLHRGKWVEDFNDLVVQRKQEIAEQKKRDEDDRAKRMVSENAKTQQILSEY